MPRAGLDRAGVVRIATEVVDVGGFGALTLAAVAASAGVAVPSLYKHTGSLAELRRSVALAATRDLTRTAALAIAGVSGEEAVLALGLAVRRWALEHPGRYLAAQTAPADVPDPGDEADELAAAAQAFVQVAAAALRGFGLPPERTVDAVRALRSGVHGFVALELAGGFRLPDDLDASFEALLHMLAAGVQRLAAPSVDPGTVSGGRGPA